VSNSADRPFKNIIRSRDQLFDLGCRQAELLHNAQLPHEHGLLPLAITPSLLTGCTWRKDDPILKQFLPDVRELTGLPVESPDPLGENLHGELPGLIHQYPNRVLIRANSECAAYCRFCYRRSLLHGRRGYISDKDIVAIAAYLRQRRHSVREVLLSGGDPLFASLARITGLLAAIRNSLPDALIRICTRIPIVAPEMIQQELLSTLSNFEPLIMVLHCNHPAELSPAVRAGLRAMKQNGLSMISQTVLLRGINDDSTILEELFNQLLACAVQPYYLFQGDLALGTGHFRVPLSRGLQLYAELRRKLSGLALPRYAVDAPDGKGKMYLPEDIVGRTEAGWLLRNAFGKEAVYPEEAVDS